MIVRRRIFHREYTSTGANSENQRMRTLENEESVLEILQNNSSTSTRAIDSYVRISHSFVWRILHTNDMHPYHIQRVQLLNEDDFAPRLAFARWYLEMHARDPRFPDTVLFTDEVTFTREEMFNSHSSHV